MTESVSVKLLDFEDQLERGRVGRQKGYGRPSMFKRVAIDMLLQVLLQFRGATIKEFMSNGIMSVRNTKTS